MENIPVKPKRKRRRIFTPEQQKEKMRIIGKAWYEANKEKAKANRRLNYLKNREKNLAQDKARYLKNKEKITAQSSARRKSQRDADIEAARKREAEYRKAKRREIRQLKSNWREKHPEAGREYYHKNKDAISAKRREHAAENKEYYTEKASRRRATLKGQTPASRNLKIILTFYKLARRLTKKTGFQWHVDHIIPIDRGGLHTHTNLQVIPGPLNCAKRNLLMEEALLLPQFKNSYLATLVRSGTCS